MNGRLHPYRRRRALRRIEDVGVPSRVLFVCHGNICRSPYAEAALRRDLDGRLREQIEIDSAGFTGPDRGSPHEAVDVAAERSVDLSDHRSRLLEPEAVRTSDLVFVMDGRQQSEIRRRYSPRAVLLLGDLDSDRAGRRRILDPVMQPAEVFRDVYDRIDRCVGTLARLLAGRQV